MSSSELPDYAHPSQYGMAILEVDAHWNIEMERRMGRDEPILALRGAGSVNGIGRAAADRLLEQQLFPAFDDEPGTILFDGDPDDPQKPDIGYIAGRLHDRYGNVLAAQADNWYYPPDPGSNLANANRQPYPTYVFKRGRYPGDHNHFTQSEGLAKYDRFGLLIVGAAGAIATSQMTDYARKVPHGGRVNITAIRALQNEALTAEIGLQYANAVTEKDRAKFQQKLEQRRDRYGKLWNNDGRFNTEIMQEVTREDDGYELAVLWTRTPRQKKSTS